MRFNIEVDLDWIGENGDLDETIQNSIINSVTQKVSEGIIKTVTERASNLIEQKLDKLVDKTFKQIVGRQIVITDNYGDVKKRHTNLKSMLKEKFDNFLLERVDDRGNKSNHGTARFDYFVNNKLNSFSKDFTTKTIKEIEAKLKSTLDQDLKDLIGSRFMEVLDVKGLLENSKKQIKS